MTRVIFGTAEYHQRFHVFGTATRAMEILADPHAPAREWERENGWGSDRAARNAFTIGTLTATIGGLLDVLGFPVQGPAVGQRSWLDPPDDEDDADEL